MKNKQLASHSNLMVIAIAVIISSFFVKGAQAQTVVPFTSNTTWTCPAGVTSVQVDCWGAGGGGGATGAVANGGSGGGGGGAYAGNISVPVTPGNTYTITVGTSAAGSAGGATWFSTTGTVFAAGGGAGGSGTTFGAGGTVAASTGTVKHAGGNGAAGANGTSGIGGAGGGGGGTTADGSAASGTSLGAGGSTGGGNGTAGVTGTVTNANTAGTPGGGGGGSHTGSGGANRPGTAGGAGKLILTYTVSTGPCSGTPTPGTATAVASSLCPNGSTTINLTGFTNGVTGITFQWQTSSTGLAGSFANVSTGTGGTTSSYTTPALANAGSSVVNYYYQCVVTCSAGPTSATSNTVNISVNPTPSLKVNGSNTYSATMCSSGSPNNVALTVVNSSAGTTTYSWSPNSTISPNNTSSSVTVTPVTTQTYTVTGTVGTCTATATAAITVNPSAVTASAGSNTIAIGGNTTLTASATSTAGTVTYAWSPSSTLSASTGSSVTANPLSSTVYTVTATDPSGCSRTNTVTVNVSSGSTGTVGCGYTWSYIYASNNYVDASSLSSVNTVASGTTSTLDDAVYPNQTIPFAFNFNDQAYSSLGISSNGFVWFGSGSVSATQYTPLSSTTGQTGQVDGIIAPFARNTFAYDATFVSTVKTAVTGTAPNRVFVVEWNGFTTGNENSVTILGTTFPTPYPRMDWQLRLYEGTNVAEYWYRAAPYDLSSASGSTPMGGQVGMRGATTTDFLSRKADATNSKWNSSTAGVNTDICVVSGGATVANCWPAANGSTQGQTYRYTPTAKPTITPAGQQNICAGSSVTLTAVNSGSMSTPTYQWQVYGTPNTNISGQTATTYNAAPATPGNYFYTVKLTSGTCVRNSDAAAVVVTSCGPLAHNVTGGTHCTSTTVGVDGSEIGVSYQLVLNGTNTGSPVAGTGSAISFGAQTTAGTYTVVATSSSSLTMTGNATVNANPTAYNVTGGTICTSDAVGLSNSQSGVNYQLVLNGTNTGSPVAGTNAAISFGTQSTVGTYTVTAANATTGCSATMTGNATVNTAPGAVAITPPSATIVSGGSGVNLTASSSGATGFAWSPTSGLTPSNGLSATENANPTSSTTYTVTASNAAGCTASNTVAITYLACATNNWTGTSVIDSHDWFDVTNWSCGIVPTSSVDVVIPNTATSFPQITGGPAHASATAKNVTVQSGASISVLGVNGVNLEVYGNFSNSGTPSMGAGKISFKGSAAQTINGNNNFKNLEIDNTSGVTLSSGAQKVSGVLNLVHGTLTTGGRLTIASDASGTGLIDNFSGTNAGTISGNLTFQRYATNSGSAFFYMGSPVGGATIADWSADFANTGLNGATDGSQVLPTPTCDLTQLQSTSPYAGIFDYRENAVTNCNLQGWHTRFSGTIPSGQGFIGRVPFGTTIDLTGSFNSGSSPVQSITLTRSSTNTTGSKGFNLSANPFAAPIEWTDVAAGNSGIQGTAYVFEVTGGLSGTYLPLNQITGGGQIGTSEAFFVDVATSQSSTTLSFTKSMERNGTNLFLRTAAPYEHIVTLDIAGNGFADKARVAFGQNFTAGFDRDYDARKMHSRAGQPSLFLTEAADEYSIYAQPSPTQVKTVPMSLEAGATGNFTITANDLGTFDPTALVYLEDLKLGVMQNLMADKAYSFTADVNDNPARFVLHFVPAASVSVNNADCKGQNGLVVADLGNYQVAGQPVAWTNYTVTATNGAVMSVGAITGNRVSISNLPTGNYNLNLITNGYTATKQINIANMPKVVASFTPNVLVAHVGDAVQFTNNTTGATQYDWQFGDGSTATAATAVSHQYLYAGDYEVVLQAQNNDCADSYSQTVKVDEKTTGISNVEESSIRITGLETKVTITFKDYADAEVKVTVFDALGRIIDQASNVDAHKNVYTMNLNDIANGYYFVQVAGNSKTVTQKVFLGKQ